MFLMIADNGTTALTLRLEDEGLEFAADELQRYLAIITGASVSHSDQPHHPEILLRLQSTDGEEHGWYIAPDRLTLYGDCPLSVLHAVYHFLEVHCGCRWLAEFEGGEIIPRLETLAVPCEEQQFRPAFSYRAFTNFPDINIRTVAMVDWMAKNRFNRFMVFANVSGSFEAYERFLRRELVARGLQVEMGHHSFCYFLPPGEFFDAHPEYYALLDGERTAEGQLCTSNPAVVELVTERLGQFLDDHPEIDTVGLWPNDGYGWCQCPACLALEPQEPAALYPEHPRRTDTYLQFVNAVAERLARTHPDRFLSALAYVNYVEPPRRVVPLPNVKVCFAPFQRCFKHPLAGPEDCVRPNATYAHLLAQWRALLPGPLYLFEYFILIDMLSVPYRIGEVLKADLQYYAAVGADGYVLEFTPSEWGPYGLNAHLIGRLSWNPYDDLESFLENYAEDLYGPAAEQMRRYFEAFDHDFVAAGPCVYHYDLEYTRRATPQLLRPACDHLGQALALAATGERRHREAVLRAQVGTQLLLRLGQWRNLAAKLRQEAPERRAEYWQAVQASEQELSEWVRTQAKTDAIDVAALTSRLEREHQALL